MSNWSEAVTAEQARTARCPKCQCDRRIERHRTYLLCNTCAFRWDPRSYDEKQAVNVQVRCVDCGKPARATLPQPDGVPCWDKQCARS